MKRRMTTASGPRVQPISSRVLPCVCSGSPLRTPARKRTTHTPTRTATSSPMAAQIPSVCVNSDEIACACGECGSKGVEEGATRTETEATAQPLSGSKVSVAGSTRGSSGGSADRGWCTLESCAGPGEPPSKRPPTRRLTLARFFLGAIVGVTLLFGGLFFSFLESSRQSVLQRAQVLRESAALRIETEVHGQLRQGQRTLQNIERAIHSGVVDASRPDAVETLLTTELLDDDQAVGISFAHADELDVDATGQMEVAPDDRWQLSVFRSNPAQPGALSVRRTERVDGQFVVI